jgi:CO dehydrogenase maturation factor
VRRLARDLRLTNIGVVGNKVRHEKDAEFIRRGLPEFEVLGYIPYSDEIVEADLAGKAVYDMSPTAVEAVREIRARLGD